MAISGYLLRLTRTDAQTMGRLIIYKDTTPIFEACTLELPWRDNQRCVSCIPSEKVYRVERRYSEKYKDHWLVCDVPDRSLILLHQGNFANSLGPNCQTRGCILIGSATGFTDINNDGELDVVSSRRAMLALNAALCDVDEFHLRIVG